MRDRRIGSFGLVVPSNPLLILLALLLDFSLTFGEGVLVFGDNHSPSRTKKPYCPVAARKRVR